ncbi:sas10 c-terminal domain-containing protein [Cystoisospora suis]|uniref:Sas10 c-terminal domain-containing protein n=1 Tax=Cystoisospora suis TaxID=483139 RepID=A0A2C6LCA3_9APIC|nr:sas10 c-terminal domain-containing protein [Cystoisospora suis]
MDYPGNEQVRGVKEKAERELRRAAERLKRSELVRAVREEIGDAPEEMGVERWLQSHHSKLGMAASIAKKQKAREAFEEENMLRLSSSKKDRKERQLARKLEEEQRRMTVGTTLSELTAFTDTALGVYDDEGGEEDISIGGRGRQAGGGGRSSNALGMYLNAARQAAETAKKVDEALQTDRAIFSRQQNLLLSQLQHKKKNEETRKAHQKKRKEEDSDADYDDMLGPDSLGLSSGKKRKNKNNRTDERDDLAEPSAEDLEAFDELLQTQKSRKIAKKKQIEERAKAFVPSVPEEVEGQRATTRQILKNKGLTRKRKKVEGNARVHNRRKYEAKMRKLKTIRGGEREVEGDSYMGEESGIRANLKKSRNLSS